MAFNLINFKKGTLAGLETLKTNNGVEEGTFYLTIDQDKETSRLFIGTGASSALPINNSIITVQNPSDLNNTSNITPYQDGDFAYVTNGNILAVKKGNGWTQINGVDNSRIWTSFTPSISTTGDTATISWAMENAANDTLPDDQGNTPAITMEGANGVTVSSNANALTITGTAYELNSAAVQANSNTAVVKLQSKASESGNLSDVSSITVSAGNNVKITGTANNIVIAAEDIKLDSNALSLANNATQGFDISVQDTDNNGNTITLDPKLTLGTHTATADEIHFVNGVANLNVYTKNEIDQKLTTVDAMSYQGIISGSDLINQTSGLHKGDTYKASANFTLPAANSSTAAAVSVKAGDLVIVSSSNTEGANGEINSTPVKYDVVPSGDDFYVFNGLGANGTGNGIQIEDGSNNVLASLEIAAGNQIAVSSTHDTNNDAIAAVTVAHGTISASTNGDANTPTGNASAANTQGKHASKTFDVVTGLTTSNGHVTGTTVERIQVVDTVSQIDTANTDVAVTAPASGQTDFEKAATVTATIALEDENNTAVNSDTLAFTLRSDNLKITTSGSTITANYVWGQF